MRSWRGAAAAAIAVRLAALAFVPDNLLKYPAVDPDHYGHFAECLWRTGIYGRDAAKPVPSAYRPPLYPLLLAPLLPLGNGAVAALHALAAVFTVWATARLARTASNDDRAATIAAWLVALDPLLIGQSALLMTETVFVALVAGWLMLWLEGKPRAAGVLLGLAALCRPTAWALGVAALLGRRRAWQALAVALVMALPWGYRNFVQFGTPILATTHGGYTLFLGMNPSFHATEIRGGRVWNAQEEVFLAEVDRSAAGRSEVAADRALRQAALDWIRTNPGAAAESLWHHVRSLWAPFPRRGPEALRWPFGLWSLGLYAAAGIGAWKARRNRAALALLCVPVALTVVHAVLWSNVRMRAPALPVLAVFAATALAPRRV